MNPPGCHRLHKPIVGKMIGPHTCMHAFTKFIKNTVLQFGHYAGHIFSNWKSVPPNPYTITVYIICTSVCNTNQSVDKKYPQQLTLVHTNHRVDNIQQQLTLVHTHQSMDNSSLRYTHTRVWIISSNSSLRYTHTIISHSGTHKHTYMRAHDCTRRSKSVQLHTFRGRAE